MTRRSISISEDVHRDLKSLKMLERDTFSDVIRRVLDAQKEV